MSSSQWSLMPSTIIWMHTKQWTLYSSRFMWSNRQTYLPKYPIKISKYPIKCRSSVLKMPQKSEYSHIFTIMSPSTDIVTDVSTMPWLPFTWDLSPQVNRSSLQNKFFRGNRIYKLPYTSSVHVKNCKTERNNLTVSALFHKNTIHTYFTTTKVLSQTRTVFI